MERIGIRTCPLCEAGCGLKITMKDDHVVSIRGDEEDVFSHGFICPKGTTLGALHEDPDRIRTPLIKRNGAFVPASFEEAFDLIAERLTELISEHGRDCVGVYLGNPNAHNIDTMIYGKPFIKALGTHNVFSASTVDQRPKELTSALMFGGPLTAAVPDIDRTDYLLILGANPLESNGSLATAPDWPGRLQAIRKRGGKVVVVDPRRSRTAEVSDEHLAIKPGADALFLAAIATTLYEENLVSMGRLAEFTNGVTETRDALKPFTAESTATHTGIEASVTRRIARELASAQKAAVYGRIGTTTQRFGTLSSWLVDVINVLTGNLDRPGGAMFTKAAAGASNTRGSREGGREVRTGRFTSRVRGLKETFGELPVATLAEEILTEGPGQIKAMITLAGNPVISTPNAAIMDKALESLEFMIAIDIFVNETTRHADVILPVPSVLERSHYDLALLQLAVRNVANYSAPLVRKAESQPHEWEIVAKLALIAQGMPASTEPSVADEVVCRTLVEQADLASSANGLNADEVMKALEPRVGPERILDFMLRTGPYGNHFGANPDGLTLQKLMENEHGIDFGALELRLPDALRTASGNIELAPKICLEDVPRLRAALDEDLSAVVLVGRRHLRSNNSWLHNVPAMMKGKDRCTLHVHPDDASRYGLKDGELATVKSKAGVVNAPVEITEDIRPGVVSLPHGWGHDLDGVQLSVASAHAGVNSNILTDPNELDAPTGNAVLNGIPVELTPA
ncbi:MAG: molybdopterin oxidoreductase family protein [Actinomycetota bacterium]